MQDLLILGVGPHSAELVEIVERINAVRPAWRLLGLVSPDGQRIGELHNGTPIGGGPELLDAGGEAMLVAECGWPHSLEQYSHRLATIIDPSSFISKSAQIGVGCVIYPHCYVGFNARLGDGLWCLSGSIVNHDDVIGEGCTLCSGVRIAGNVTVGDGCYLGQACTIRQCLRIGRHSLVGMGAVVVGDVPPDSVMVGNPARRLRANSRSGR